MRIRTLSAVVLAAGWVLVWPAHAEMQLAPAMQPGAARLITLEDIASVREIDSLTLSPDGRRFAIFVRQADPATNSYRSAWFVGDTRNGALTFAGDGGEIRYRVRASGHMVGEVSGPGAQWSPDGRWFAYPLESKGEVQLWRSSADGTRREQLTSGAGDVGAFIWDDRTPRLWFESGPARAEVRRREEERYRQGYRYDEDLFNYTDLMLPRLRPLEPPNRTIQSLELPQLRASAADEAEQRAFKLRTMLPASGRQSAAHVIDGAVLSTATHANGRAAWLRRAPQATSELELVAALEARSTPIVCEAAQCNGMIERLWWSRDGTQVYFWRREGVGDDASGFYAWSPQSLSVRKLASVVDHELRFCDIAADERLICVREGPERPAHVAAIDLETGGFAPEGKRSPEGIPRETGAVSVVADVNAEFDHVRLGRVERFEWETPRFAWQEPSGLPRDSLASRPNGRLSGPLFGVYPARAYGYVFYPPDFDPRQRYPVVIEPYVASGFNASVGNEHALHVYAAQGFIVLSLSFPRAANPGGRLGGAFMAALYSAEHGYPHLAMLAGSTLRALDTILARGAIDRTRVGIGGVSHGTFVPLQILQRHDRITAISISSATWGPHEYYSGTARSARANQAVQRAGVVYQDWRPNPATAQGRDFWRGFDIAEHIDEIEAPILMNVPAEEMHTLVRLIRNMRDASRPYDTYVFADETHLKWQPAHLAAIRARNLDWFRFWLQDIEAPDPAKAEQYVRWRQLRELQCRNPRSLRNYCAVAGTQTN